MAKLGQKWRQFKPRSWNKHTKRAPRGLLIQRAEAGVSLVKLWHLEVAQDEYIYLIDIPLSGALSDWLMNDA